MTNELNAYSGRAYGGPRDGIYITADRKWFGTIRGHNGYYKWDPTSEIWCWFDGKLPQLYQWTTIE